MAEERLTYRRIFAFWAPLAAQWLMMAAEAPFLAAVIARLPAPEFNLAAYGVAMALTLIIEAPIVMIIGASTALAKDREAFLKLKNFIYALNGLVTAAMILICLPPVFDLIGRRLIGLPAEVADLTKTAMIILIPWPAAIGYRRFYHGLLIRNAQTRAVAYGTVVRLASMVTVGLVFYWLYPTQGAYMSAAAMSIGVLLEAGVTRHMARRVIGQVQATPLDPLENALTYREIVSFYVPLALTSLLALGVRPIITFFLGQSRMALESLAVLPVVHGLVFIPIALGLSFQEVGLALLGEKNQNFVKLRNFAVGLGGSAVLALSAIGFTPLALWWLADVSGLSPELAEFARLPLQILIITPGLAMGIFFQRALLMAARRTRPITWATGVEVTAIIVAMVISVHGLDLVGVVAATLAIVSGNLAANVFLLPRTARVIRR